MLSAYLFSLIVGGSFLVLSLLGDAFDTEADFEAELDMELDAELDADGSGDAASKVFSFRTVVYTLFGFGAVGTPLTLLGAAGPGTTLAVSVLSGLAAGAIIHSVFQYLRRTDSGALPDDAGYVGLTGRVTLPLAPGSPGTIVVERGARRVTLRALPHRDDATPPPGGWRSVVVVEMDGPVARVAPVEEDLALGS